LQIVSELGYVPVGWNIESYYAVLRKHDLKTEPVAPIADEVYAHVSAKAKGGSIILLHFNPYDTERLDEIITAIKEKGLTMHLLSECLEY
jgi:peptidoglycan-N-acetylmuramic acid deacetylase